LRSRPKQGECNDKITQLQSHFSNSATPLPKMPCAHEACAPRRGPTGFELRTFDCSKCDHAEQIAIPSDPMKSDWVVHRRITSPDVRPPQLATSFIQPHQVPSASEHPRQPPSRRCSRLHASRPVRLRRRDFFQGSQPNRFAKVRDLGVTIYRRRIHVRLQLTCGRDASR
jgi:hypothetical protein